MKGIILTVIILLVAGGVLSAVLASKKDSPISKYNSNLSSLEPTVQGDWVKPLNTTVGVTFKRN